MVSKWLRVFHIVNIILYHLTNSGIQWGEGYYSFQLKHNCLTSMIV